MAKLIVLLSGSVSSGKSTLAERLKGQFGFELIKTWQLLHHLHPDVPLDRQSLQDLGEELDRKTNGEWVVRGLQHYVNQHDADALIIVDAVRILDQIKAVRRGYGAIVKHIHLSAPQEVLEKRYSKRKRHDIKELASYEEVLKSETERNVPDLAGKADIDVDTARCTAEDVLVRAACQLGLYGRGFDRVVDVLIGGQFGSEGKGQVAAYLARDYDMLIRVGGPNAGHKVFEDPEPYAFHTLPSGTRHCSAHLVIGPGAVIDVPTILREINECSIAPDRLSIDPQALIITDADRRGEEELVRNIGSTGQGVGWATARRIRDRGVNHVMLARDVDALAPFVRSTSEVIGDR